MIFSLFLNETLSCDHSKESPQRGDSFEWSQDRASLRNNENIMRGDFFEWSKDRVLLRNNENIINYLEENSSYLEP